MELSTEMWLYLIYLPQILSSLVMCVVVWYDASPCEMNLKAVCVCLYVISVALPLCMMHGWVALRGKWERLLVWVSCAFMFLAYVYTVVGLVVNHLHTPQCYPKWTYIVEWVCVGVTTVSVILPLAVIAYYLIYQWRREVQHLKLKKRAKNMIIDLYDEEKSLEEVIVQSQAASIMKRTVKESRFGEDEMKYISDETNGLCVKDESNEYYCVVCGGGSHESEKHDGGAYLKIPGCEHLYHMRCFAERNDSDANMYCVVCNNYIRISILSDIHKRQIDELLKLFNVRRRRRMNLTKIGDIDDDMMNE